jgi:predicted MPP superfamily phosphohydrolase
MDLNILWLTDIHLNYLFPYERKRFLFSLSRLKPDIVLVGGDLSKACSLENDLKSIQKMARAPVFFVLGNHDYFGSSFSAVHDGIARLIRQGIGLHWLENIDYVNITQGVALVGRGCWGDARIGSYWNTELHRGMPDFREIADLKILNRYDRLKFLKNMGEKSARHMRKACISAAQENSHVIILTHVPPFPQAILSNGRKDESGLPFFCCLEAGKVIRRIAETYPNVRFTVLSGHTHVEARIRLMPNLEAIVQSAQYHRPNYKILSLENGILLYKEGDHDT